MGQRKYGNIWSVVSEKTRKCENSQILSEEWWTDADSLWCSSKKGTWSIWLVKLQYIVFALWTSYNTQKQTRKTTCGTWQHWYSIIMNFWDHVKCSKAHTSSVLSKKNNIDILVNQFWLTIDLTKYKCIYIYKAPITEVAELNLSF